MSIHDQRDKAINIAILFASAAIIAGTMWGIKTIEVKRYQKDELEYIEQVKAKRLNIITLCAAVNDQEHILRREAPWIESMSWVAKTREICK